MRDRTCLCGFYRGAVGLDITELWQGVLCIDGDDNLTAGLVPVKSTRHHRRPLEIERVRERQDDHHQETITFVNLKNLHFL